MPARVRALGCRQELAAAAAAEPERVHERGGLHEPDGVTLLPPVPAPRKIICLGLNYYDHAAEVGAPIPTTPMFFAKWATSLIADGDAIVPPATTARVDYEAELAVIIGAQVPRNTRSDSALAYVAGVSVLNDVTARDLQRASPLWTGGKAIDTFAPFGPAIVTLDEVGDLQALGLRTTVNGKIVQEGSTAQMIFSVPDTIAYLSTILTLLPGDVIATGTCAGVGASRGEWLAEGDVVEVEVERVGKLTNPVAAPVGSAEPVIEAKGIGTI
jgi:acylpyruvate hydrolase